MSFQGLRVLALESRRSAEMAELIRKQGGEPFVAPSMREVPIEENSDTFRFAGRLFAGGFDMMALLTGIGTRQLNRVLAVLRKITVCSIGPTTTEALEEFGIHPSMEPSHPKMGILVHEAALQSEARQ